MRGMKDSGIGWLGEVPAGWCIVPGKRILTLLQCPVEDGDGVVTCFRDGEVTLRTNRRTDGFTIALKEIGYQGVEPGDLVVHGMDGFAGSIGISDSRGKASPVLNVMDSDQNKRFLMYYMRGLAYRDVYMALSDGIRVRSCNLSWKKIGSLPFALPGLNEQRRIADFLDEKCVEIDRAISAAEQSIEEYRAYQNDVVKRAIVYGSCNAFKVKESGVPAIGKMNASWGLVMVKRLAVFLNGDRSDSYPSGDDIQEAGIPFITSGDLNGRYLPDVFSKYISQDKYDSLKGVKLRRGDVVFCLRGSVGKCSLNRTENCGTVASSLTVARPICCAPEWLSYALTCSSTTNQAIATAIGATSANLAANVLARAFVPLPPLSEQCLIADYLDEKCTQIDAAIAAKQAIIADLKAYKQSLIYETVTGKREV